MIAIGYIVTGKKINEWLDLCDSARQMDGDVPTFDTVEDAHAYLRANGFTQKDIDKDFLFRQAGIDYF